MRFAMRTTIAALVVVCLGMSSRAEDVQRIPVPECDVKHAASHGKDFSEAYALFLDAPTQSYDYSSAESAFRKIKESSDGEKRTLACYFEILCQFASRNLRRPAAIFLSWVSLIKKAEPDGVKARIAEAIVDASKKDMLDNVGRLKSVIADSSRLKLILPNKGDEKLMGVVMTAKVLFFVDLMDKMRGSRIYELAPAAIAKRKKAEGEDRDKELVASIERRLAEWRKCEERDFLAIVGVLSLESSFLADRFPDVANGIAESICAHNLKQLGIAFHLYLLDHDGKFPPLCELKRVKIKDKDADLRELWIDKLKPYFGYDDGELADCYGIYRTMPAVSVFQCPAASTPRTVGGECQFGYNAMYPFAYTKDVETNLASGTVAMSMIKPESHLVLADTWYFGAKDGRGCPRLYSLELPCPRHNGLVNVLYADGHVNAEDINWLWEADGSGAPWDSNKPYKKRANVGQWKHQVDEYK